MSMFNDAIGLICIDLPANVIMIPFAQDDVLKCAEIAKAEKGRLRMRVNDNASTANVMVGCRELGDWRDKGGK